MLQCSQVEKKVIFVQLFVNHLQQSQGLHVNNKKYHRYNIHEFVVRFYTFLINSIYRASFNNSASSKLVLNNISLEEGNGGKLRLRRDPIQTFVPEIVLNMNSQVATTPYTIGARIYQKTSLAQGTISGILDTTQGVQLTIKDISGPPIGPILPPQPDHKGRMPGDAHYNHNH